MKKSGAELGQQAQAAAAAAGARAGAATARGALRGMRQSPGGRGARGGPEAPAGDRGPALRLPHPARPAPCAALGPRRTPEERGRRFPGVGEACRGRRLPARRPPRSGSRRSGSPASASYMEDPRGQKKRKRKKNGRRSTELREGGKTSFPLAKQLNLGVGRSRQFLEKKKKKKQARDLFFSSISLVTGSPQIPCTRRLGGGGRVDFTPHEMSGEIKAQKSNNQICQAPTEKHHHLLAHWRAGAVRLEPGFKNKKMFTK